MGRRRRAARGLESLGAAASAPAAKQKSARRLTSPRQKAANSPGWPHRLKRGRVGCANRIPIPPAIPPTAGNYPSGYPSGRRTPFAGKSGCIVAVTRAWSVPDHPPPPWESSGGRAQPRRVGGPSSVSVVEGPAARDDRRLVGGKGTEGKSSDRQW